MLRELAARGLGVIVTEQNHRLALEMAHRVIILEKGQAVWTGDAARAADPGVVGQYLMV
jgi:ABC-type branched-subunit amino acid transport system ATPase component